LRDLVVANDAQIREAAEAAWWDELLEGAATRLVGVAADHLDSQINRSGVDAKVVLSIDAMGPRTAAIAIVAADGRLIHTEDIPCQLTTAMRSAAVTRVGELIHQYGVDLIVISNGPARRACLVILHELVEQSTPGSIRWTIAERSGADVYAGSELGNREMRSTPRRFRSAAWLAFAVLATFASRHQSRSPAASSWVRSNESCPKMRCGRRFAMS
jgi:protein Tex